MPASTHYRIYDRYGDCVQHSQSKCHYNGEVYIVHIRNFNNSVVNMSRRTYSVICSHEVMHIKYKTSWQSEVLAAQSTSHTVSLALGYGATHCAPLVQYLVDDTDISEYIGNTTGDYMSDTYNANMTYILKKYRELIAANSTYACAPNMQPQHRVHSNTRSTYVNVVYDCNKFCVYSKTGLQRALYLRRDGMKCANWLHKDAYLLNVNNTTNNVTALDGSITTKVNYTANTQQVNKVITEKDNIVTMSDIPLMTTERHANEITSLEGCDTNNSLVWLSIVPSMLCAAAVASYVSRSNSKGAKLIRDSAECLYGCISHCVLAIRRRVYVAMFGISQSVQGVRKVQTNYSELDETVQDNYL